MEQMLGMDEQIEILFLVFEIATKRTVTFCCVVDGIFYVYPLTVWKKFGKIGKAFFLYTFIFGK